MYFKKPDSIKINARKVNLEFTSDLPVQWYTGNPAILSFCNIVSIMFPVGEQFFIDSVRHYRDKLTGSELQDQVTAFLAQESMHSRQHTQCNNLLKNNNKHLIFIEKISSLCFYIPRNYYPKSTVLAISCALEHFTAIFADNVLRSKYFTKLAHPVYANLWLWHAAEEIEHKAVCYDVYQQITGGGIRGYIERCIAMFGVTLCILLVILLICVIMLFKKIKERKLNVFKQKEKIKNPHTTGWFRYLFIKPGIISNIATPYFAYYVPGFHPWKYDNSDIVVKWKQKYEKYLIS